MAPLAITDTTKGEPMANRPGPALTISREPLADLRTYHRNPRQGDVEAIRDSLRVNGQYRPLVVNRGAHTGRKNEVLAGNHTLKAAREEGWAELDVCWLDVDEDQAARIVAADNKTSDLARYDDAMLVELLRDLQGFEGTGYTEGEVDDLAAALEEQAAALPARDPDDPTLPAFAPGADGMGGERGEPDRDEVDGARHSKDMSAKANTYLERDVRSIYLTFSITEFEWTVDRMTELCAKFDVDSNTDVVMRLLAEATGNELP